MPITIRELSRLCGVSTATVSLVLSDKDEGRVSARQRERILQLAEEFGYRSNLIAKGLAEGKTYRVGLVIEGTLSEHAILGQFSLYERLGLLAAKLQSSGYSVEIVQVNTARELAENCRELSRRAVDGYLFLNWQQETLSALLVSLQEKRIPVVVSGATLRDDSCAWVDVDRAAPYADVVKRLVGDGHRKMAFIDCALTPLHLPLKRQAFVEAVRQRLNADATEWVFTAPDASYETTTALVESAVHRMGDVRAFVLTDNFYAEAVMQALRRLGYSPGQDCRVIGFGDTPLAERCTPKMSHYGLQVEAQAAFSVEELLAQIQSPDAYRPRHQLLGPQFLERAT